MRIFRSLAVSAALLASTSAIAQTAPLATIRIQPSALDETKGGHLNISVDLPELSAEAGAELLTLTLEQIGIAKAQPITDLVATDAQGPVPLASPNGKVGVWNAGRAVRGGLKVQYRLPLENIQIVSGTPPINLRLDGDGFSGIGDNLIMTPATEKAYRIAIIWDLSAMGKGASAVSSYGEGDITLPAGSFDRISDAYFMAGTLKRAPLVATGPFSAAWTGNPDFDPTAAMEWTAKLRTWMSRHFKDEREAPYRVFLRYNPMNAGGGSAHISSFIVTYGKGVTGEGMKSLLGHEMTHTWTALGMHSWFSEGNAVFYQALLPWRAGLMTPDQFLADLNDTASRYYSNLLNNVPDEQIEPRFWEDTRIRVIPYDRGAMYFAILNDKIVKASGGKKSVDDLVQAMIDRDRRAQPVTEAVWVDLVREQLGEDGVKLHRDMMAGALMVPNSDAFGPCFSRTTKKVRRFELGFDPKSLIGTQRRIKGLIPGSEAAKAGLRDGDAVTYGVALDGVQSDPARTFTLQVTREGSTFPITYLPRGETVEVYQWQRTGIPDKQCKL